MAMSCLALLSACIANENEESKFVVDEKDPIK
jgi:hypothetical protein